MTPATGGKSTLTPLRAIHLLVVGALAAASLSQAKAESALRSRLERLMGIAHPSVACDRKASTRFACRWHGRRGDVRYAGRADVRRVHGTIVVTLSRVHRA